MTIVVPLISGRLPLASLLPSATVPLASGVGRVEQGLWRGLEEIWSSRTAIQGTTSGMLCPLASVLLELP